MTKSPISTSMIGAIVDELAPSLVARNSIGHGAAAQLLLTAGDNVQRLQSEASFAAKALHCSRGVYLDQKPTA